MPSTHAATCLRAAGVSGTSLPLESSTFVHRGTWAGALVVPEGRRRYAYLLRVFKGPLLDMLDD